MADKKYLILIRGLTRGQGHWADFLPLLRERAPHFEVECLDLPGNGERFREKSFLETAAVARDLRSKSRFIAAGKKVTVLGHSLGGMVAVEWARQFPQDFEKLFLMNTSAANSGPWFRRLNFTNFSTLFKRGLAGDAEERERLVLSLIANNSERTEKLIPELARYSATHRVTPANAVRQLWSAARTRFPSVPPVPTEILAAAKDRLVSSTNSIELGKLWKIPVRMHPWGGHDLAVDDPHWLVEQLL